MGFTFGIAFGAQTRPFFGVDLRLAAGEGGAAIARVEVHGFSSVRLVAAGHRVSEGGLGAELGLALHSSRRGTPIGPSIGLHLAFGAYGEGLGAQVHGHLPFWRDRDNWEAGAGVVLVPGELKLFCGGGRALRDGAVIRLPDVAHGCDPRRELDGHPARAADDELAQAWIEDARAEYASVWAFERMAAELAAVGAPAGLVRGALAARDDEARHTRLCARQAGAPFRLLPLDERHATPRWRRPTAAALSTLVREAWTDGCLGEGIAAAQAGAAAAGARGAARDTQSAIAVDEHRHAELSWSILEWAWREGGAPARDPLIEAISRDPSTPVAATPDVDPDRFAAAGRLAPAPARASADRCLAASIDRARRAFG